jgi:hypothetical protein
MVIFLDWLANKSRLKYRWIPVPTDGSVISNNESRWSTRHLTRHMNPSATELDQQMTATRFNKFHLLTCLFTTAFVGS